MIAVGFRVRPKEVTYALVRRTDESSFTILDVSSVHVPPALDVPRRLQFVRTVLLDIIDEYGALRAGLRCVEGNSQKKDPFRMNLEGVVQELLASSSVEHFIAGPLNTLASLLGFGNDAARVKRLVTGQETPQYAAKWAEFSGEEREAILAAVAAASATRSLADARPTVPFDMRPARGAA